MNVPVRIKLVILSKLRAYHTKTYVYLCWTFGRGPSLRLVEGCPATANTMNNRNDNRISTHGFGIPFHSDNFL